MKDKIVFMLFSVTPLNIKNKMYSLLLSEWQSLDFFTIITTVVYIVVTIAILYMIGNDAGWWSFIRRKVYSWLNIHVDDEQDRHPERYDKLGTDFDKTMARQRIVNVLKELNCFYENAGNGWINFIYQGASFNVNVDDESYLLSIAFLNWYNVPIDDLRRMSCMQKAVNSVNSRLYGSTVFYCIDNKTRTVEVHDRMSCILPNSSEEDCLWVQSILHSLFLTSHEVVKAYTEECSKLGVPVKGRRGYGDSMAEENDFEDEDEDDDEDDEDDDFDGFGDDDEEKDDEDDEDVEHDKK